MAKNPNTNLSNRHCFIGAKTGGGKSQLLRNDLLPARGVRALFWDVDTDHKAARFADRGAFLAALKSAESSGGPFRIAWVGDDDSEAFNWFCRTAWAVLDGSKLTYIVCEEMADQGMGQRLPAFFRKLIVRGRKYGAIVLTTTQRCQEVPKALITQAANRYIGLHEDQDARYLQKAVGIQSDAIEALEPLSFYHKGPDGVVKISTKWKEFTA